MLKGKCVFVTGGAKGIGRAICLGFAKEGANIVLNYRSTVDDELLEEIKGYGVEVLALQGDVSNFDEAKAMLDKAVEQFGGIEVLVNNAGITRDKLLIGMAEEDWDSVINTNLKGCFNMVKHCAKLMLKQKCGSIINLSSVIGLVGNAGQANYSASKAGIIGLTHSVAKELASRSITCNAIAPGFIQTDMTKVLSDKNKEAILGGIPLGRIGEPEEIAAVAVFLAKNRYITGQVIAVDGGMTMR